MDTSGMDALGLTDRFKRICNFNRMEEWKQAVEKFMKAVSENSAATSNLTTASSQTSGLMASTEQDEEDTGKDFRTITTSLRQILRSEHDLNIVDQQLASEQKFNHEVFKEFSIVIREVTNMVISGKVSELSGCNRILYAPIKACRLFRFPVFLYTVHAIYLSIYFAKPETSARNRNP